MGDVRTENIGPCECCGAPSTPCAGCTGTGCPASKTIVISGTGGSIDGAYVVTKDAGLCRWRLNTPDYSAVVECMEQTFPDERWLAEVLEWATTCTVRGVNLTPGNCPPNDVYSYEPTFVDCPNAHLATITVS